MEQSPVPSPHATLSPQSNLSPSQGPRPFFRAGCCAHHGHSPGCSPGLAANSYPRAEPCIPLAFCHRTRKRVLASWTLHPEPANLGRVISVAAEKLASAWAGRAWEWERGRASGATCAMRRSSCVCSCGQV